MYNQRASNRYRSNGLVGNQIRVQLSNTSTRLVVCDFRVYGGKYVLYLRFSKGL